MENVEANAMAATKPSAGRNHHQTTFCTKSKDKLLNGSAAQMKINLNCKPPVVFKTQANMYSTKNHVERGAEKLDDSGDNKDGSSKVINLLAKKDNLDKLKPSMIPRRRTSKEGSIKEKLNSTTRSKEQHYLGDSRNVQRVQMLINQDYHPEEHARVANLARPIPTSTLGQIYAQTNINNDMDRIADWFDELNTPANSLDSNFFNARSRQANATKDMIVNRVNEARRQDTPHSSTTGSSSSPNKHRTSSEDTNVSEVLSSDIEYPTRDNESGYSSLSPPIHTPMKSILSEVSLASQLNVKTVEQVDCLIGNSTSNITNEIPTLERSDSILKDQPTVILAKITSTLVPDFEAAASPKTRVDQKSNKTNSTNNSGLSSDVNSQFPSIPGGSEKTDSQIPVASYVECPSEVHQKTTNFEGDGCECATPHTHSSMTGTDLECREDLSSQFTFGRDSCSCTMEWCHRSSCDLGKKTDDEDTTTADSTLCNYGEHITRTSSIRGSGHDPFEHYHCCSRTQHRDRRGSKGSRKSQRFRRFPSSRYKMHTPFSAFRKRMSVYFCSRRLSRVWKKTAERWAIWSAKSPHRIKKRRVMLFLQRSTIWEDADVQTSIHMYKETGTESELRQQKSRAIMAFVNFDWNFAGLGRHSGISVKKSQLTKSSPVSREPSSYPFLSTKTNCIGKHRAHFNPIVLGCENQTKIWKERIEMIDKETQRSDSDLSYLTLESPNLNSKSPLKLKESFGDSSSFIQICEITTADKDIVTDAIGYPLKDNVTSTYLHLNDIRALNNIQLNNANTQMCIVCNNAETEVKFPTMQDNRSASVFTAPSDLVTFYKPCGTNTESPNQTSMKVSTSPYLMKTLNCTETQVSPSTSLTFRDLLMEIRKSKNRLIDDPFGMDRIVPKGNKQVPRNDLTTQITNGQPSLMFTKNKVTSKSTTPAQTVAAATSKKDYIDTGLSVYNAGLKSGVCLTSPYNIACTCPCNANHIISRGTDTNDIPRKSTSASKLKTYFNTGMLLNTIVNQAVHDTSPKLTVCTDTKSIENKYTSDIGTCTNTVFRDSVIETEKDIYPMRLSVNTNTCLEQESKFTEQPSVTVDGPKKITFHNGTQYSLSDCKEILCAQNSVQQSERYGQSCLMSIRTLNNSFEDVAVQTDIDSFDDAFGIRRHNKCFASVSTNCATCELQNISYYDKAIAQGQANKERESRMITASKSSCNLNAGCKMNKIVLSSALDADKWIKAGIEKGFQSLLAIECAAGKSCNCNNYRDEKKTTYSKCVDSETQSMDKTYERNDCCDCSQGEPTQNIMANDACENHQTVVRTLSFCKDMAGNSDSKLVRAIIKTIEAHDKILVKTVELTDEEIEQLARPEFGLTQIKMEPQTVQMVDNTTSDMTMAKEMREMTLQVCPESSDTVTPSPGKPESKFSIMLKLDSSSKSKCIINIRFSKAKRTAECLPANEQRSASVLTTRCILPSLSDCYCENYRNGNLSGECLFVYDKPRCVVHTKQKVDISITTQTSYHHCSMQEKPGVVTVAESTSCEQIKLSISADKETNSIPECKLLQGTTSTQYDKNEVRSVGMIASCGQGKPTMCDRETSCVKDIKLIKASTQYEKNEMRSVGMIVSGAQGKPTMCDKETSCVTDIVLIKASAQYDKNEMRSVGMIVSGAEKRTMCDKEISCVSDIMSTKVSETKKCEMQSVGIITTCSQPQPSLCERATSKIAVVPSSKVRFPVKHEVRSACVETSYFPKPSVSIQTCKVVDLLPPKDYETLYKASVLISKHTFNQADNQDMLLKYRPVDAAVEAWLKAEMQSTHIMTSPDMHSATVMTSQRDVKSYADSDQVTEPVGVFCNHLGWQGCDNHCCNGCNKLLELPTHDDDIVEESVKTHIIASCRYYSTLLTKHLDHVKENLTRHLSPSSNTTVKFSLPEEVTYSEACTMKPSAREEFGCQTFRYQSSKMPSIFDQGITETDICRHDKEHLHSVYYMLTAIEGRMRRLKSSSFD